jgi:hypothetical protein
VSEFWWVWETSALRDAASLHHGTGSEAGFLRSLNS